MSDDGRGAPIPVTGVVLAGGRAERMGGRDKGLLPLAGEALVAHVLRGLRPQVARLLISANRNLASYRAWGYPVVADADDARFRGPLAGMLAALRAAATADVLTTPCDAAVLPTDYAQRMWQGRERMQATVSVAEFDGRWQPVFALLPVALADDLAAWLAAGEGGVGRWLQRHRPAVVAFPDWPTPSGHGGNINTPEELARLEIQWMSRAKEHGRNRD